MSLQQDTFPAITRFAETMNWSGAASHTAKAISSHFNYLGNKFLAARRRRQTERQLNQLTDFVLKDIGLRRSDIASVASRLSRRSEGDLSLLR
jgi:uncharacterized protein YjiS (DUF1127 family)